MFEYLKRKLFKMKNKITIDQYPQYYEENGMLIRLDEDGRRFEVDIDRNDNIQIIRELK